MKNILPYFINNTLTVKMFKQVNGITRQAARKFKQNASNSTSHNNYDVTIHEVSTLFSLSSWYLS